MTSETETQRIPVYCAMCWSSCGCIAVVENGRFISLEPDPLHPTGKAICGKGRAAPEQVYSEQRLLHPMKRTRPKGDPDPGWQQISWDEALDTTASALKGIIEDCGSEAIAFSITTTAGTAMQDGYAWVERLRQTIGTPNAVASIELCNFARDFVYPHTFGTNMPMPDFENTGCIVLWGHNPSSSWIAYATRVAEAKKRGARLVVIDPQKVGMANKADQWLQVRPGTDGALALGIAGVMIEEDLFDQSFVRDWTNGPLLVRDDTGEFLTAADLNGVDNSNHCVGWDRSSGTPVLYDPETGSYENPKVDLALFGHFEVSCLRGIVSCRPAFELYFELCREYSPERVEEITWIPAEQVRETARLIGNSGPVSIYGWAGLEQHSNSSQTNRAVALLYALTGSYDSKGGNVLFNAPPTSDISGWGSMTGEQKQKALGLKQRPLGPEAINGWITADSLYNSVLTGKPYPIKAMVGFGVNMLVSHADGLRGAKALNGLDFMVHSDIFLTPTASHADIVLPVNTAWERQGLRANFKVDQNAVNHVQLRQQVVESQGESSSDAWIAIELAKRMGYSNSFWGGDIDASYREILEPTGIDLEELKKQPRGVSADLQTRYCKYSGSGDNDAPGFNTPSKKIEIYSAILKKHGYTPLPNYVEPAMSPVSRPDIIKDFPLILTSAKSTHFLHSQGRALPALRKKEPDPTVELHPDTAAERSIENGEWITLMTPHGRIKLKAHFSQRLHRQVVKVTHGWWQACEVLSAPGFDPDFDDSANLNQVISNDEVDPIGGAVPLKAYLCEIIKVSS
jgi:anaerobic selenocysteine-containing dehydrogenase